MAQKTIRSHFYIAIILICICITTQKAYSVTRQNLSTRALRTMSRSYMAFGQYDKAYTFAKRAVIQANSEETDIKEHALCLIDLATVYGHRDMLEDAAVTFEKGVKMQKQAIGDDHPYVAFTLRMLSGIYRRQGDLGAASSNLASAFSIMGQYSDISSPDMTPFLIESAQLETAKGNFEHSKQLYLKSKQMALETYGPEHLYTAQITQGLAEVSLACGQITEARSLISQSIKMQQRHFGQSSHMLIPAWLISAKIERASGAIATSEEFLRKAVSVAQQEHNFVMLARVHQQISDVRSESFYVASNH